MVGVLLTYSKIRTYFHTHITQNMEQKCRCKHKKAHAIFSLYTDHDFGAIMGKTSFSDNQNSKYFELQKLQKVNSTNQVSILISNDLKVMKLVINPSKTLCSK